MAVEYKPLEAGNPVLVVINMVGMHLQLRGIQQLQLRDCPDKNRVSRYCNFTKKGGNRFFSETTYYHMQGDHHLQTSSAHKRLHR